ncbi:hypothetical protein SERLA73DRAFT_76347 [Serpula lacrymans var. lacrymans S7.3]|uniref:Uncharacterized protein n=1 Tax=Serpula lacrymans var. lacrymans (strain S7.3) TaxID=936435 RepID=F8Q6Z9_SERL3|nr:hypothetical protein SERLA73DRAFT_76347 [Serpula lacrymans var. lacrymans S7.3]
MSANLATWSPPPPGTNFIAILQPMITFLLPGTILSSFLIPILIAIFAFSTPHSRRQPVFVLNVLGILIGLLQGALLIYLSVCSFLEASQVRLTETLRGTFYIIA